jgi:hypothetical protein
MADRSTLVTVVQGQLDAYNAHDIEGFLAWYADDVELFRIGGERLCSGLDAMRLRYGPYFAANPLLHCRLLSRSVGTGTVVDQEWITGLADGGQLEVFAIFQIESSLIRRVWFHQDRQTPAPSEER